MPDITLSRRRVLAAVGGAGAAGFLTVDSAVGEPVSYTQTSTQTCQNATLNADWRETYTRDQETTLLENTTAGPGQNTGSENTTAEPSIIRLRGLLPADRGTVSIRFTAEPNGTTGDTTVEPTLNFRVTETAENGLNDPESEAGDTTTATGELQNHLQATVWRNTGILGIDTLGADDLEQQLTEPTLASGSFADVAASLNGASLGTIDATTDESVSVTMRWRFEDTASVNSTQTDSVVFDFDIDCA